MCTKIHLSTFFPENLHFINAAQVSCESATATILFSRAFAFRKKCMRVLSNLQTKNIFFNMYGEKKNIKSALVGKLLKASIGCCLLLCILLPK